MGSVKKLDKIIKLLQKLKVVVTLFIFILSFCFFFAHSHIELNFRTYLSENALSPGKIWHLSHTPIRFCLLVL